MASVLRAGLVAILLMAGALPAEAHNLKVFASRIGERIEGRAYFVGGGPARDIDTQAFDAAGAVLAQTRTDPENGTFTLPDPAGAAATIRADAGDGHRADFPLNPAETPPPVPAATDPSADTSAAMTAAIAEAIAPLAAQIDELDNSLRLRDIIGAIGYIAGIFGLWALWRTRPKAGR